MRSVFCLLLVASSFPTLFVSSLTAQDALDVLVNSSELAFDDDQVEPLITLERNGGLRVAPPEGFEPQPLVAVFADGTIVRGVDRPGLTEVRGKISQRQLFELLDFIVNRNQFYKADTTAIKTSLEQREPRVMIADAMSSRFAVNLKRGSHVVNVYALEFTRSQHPDIEMLDRLLAIEKRLQHHVAIVEIGDEKQVQAILQAMNRELKKKRPAAPPLLARDIIYTRRVEGGLTVNAAKDIMDSKSNKLKTKVVGSYRQKDPDSEPTLSLIHI